LNQFDLQGIFMRPMQKRLRLLMSKLIQ